MMIKIANFVTDQKFIDGVIDILSLPGYECTHEYIHISDNKNDFTFIKNGDKVKILKRERVLSYLYENNFDAVFVHGMFGEHRSIVPLIDLSIKVFWFGWGFDMYLFPRMKPAINLKLYHPRTQKFLGIKSQGLFSRILKGIKGDKELYRNKSYLNDIHCIYRADYFSGVLPVEYDLIKKNNYFRAQHVYFKYTNMSDLERYEKREKYSLGDNIIVGNSAAIRGNHLDILTYLEKLKIGGRKVYLPLSYQKDNKYIETVSREYKKSLGDRLVVLEDFMPYDEYSKIIQSCGIGIFYFEGQAAMGNINMLLWNGAKVFLSKTSIVYKYFKQMGMYIYNVQHDLIKEDFYKPLSDAMRDRNRDLIYKMKSKSTIVNNLNQIYDYIATGHSLA